MNTTANKARFEALIAAAVDGIMVINARGIVQDYSPACEQLFGYRADEVVGQNVKMLMPAPYHAEHDGYLAHYRTTSEKRIIGIGREVIGQRKDKSTFPMYLSVGEGRLGDESIFVGIVHDLTARQGAERRFREIQSELLHISRLSEIGQMASALAHELNQPLTAIANFTKAAQLLLETPGVAEIRRAQVAMQSVADQAVRAGEIIRRIREFVARGDTEKTAENVAALVDETISLAAGANRLDGVKIKKQIESNLAAVVVDKVQIQQVLLNLIRNAVEAMETIEAPEIIIGATLRDNFIEICVGDNGPGLTPEVAARLFEPFVSTKEKGMGVGLSICRTIIESHGGRLWASDSTSGGVTFSFTLARESPHDESTIE